MGKMTEEHRKQIIESAGEDIKGCPKLDCGFRNSLDCGKFACPHEDKRLVYTPLEWNGILLQAMWKINGIGKVLEFHIMIDSTDVLVSSPNYGDRFGITPFNYKDYNNSETKALEQAILYVIDRSK